MKVSPRYRILNFIICLTLVFFMHWLTSCGPGISDPSPEEVAQEMAKLNYTNKIDSIYYPPLSNHFRTANSYHLITEENPGFPSPSPFDSERYLSSDDDYDYEHMPYILHGSKYGSKPIAEIILERATQQADDKMKSLQLRLKMREDRELTAQKKVKNVTAVVGFFILGVGGWYVITRVLSYLNNPILSI
jgi:hypothetical protein